MRNVVSWITVLILVGACGGSKHHQDAPARNALSPYYDQAKDRFIYQLQDPKCVAASGLAANSGGYFNTFMDNQFGRVSSPQSFSGAPSLNGSYINQTIYNFKITTTCENGKCTDQTIDQGQLLPLCESMTSYQRETVEDIAITSFFSASVTFDFFKTTLSFPDNDSPISIFALPNWTKRSNGGSEVIQTDNLAYYPKYNAIVVYPKGSFGMQLWQNYNLWDSPWVISHEASHHLFDEIFYAPLQIGTSSALKPADSYPIINRNKLLPPAQREAGNSTGATVSEVIGAINEGFADLFAFYSHGEQQSYIDSINCFRQGRNPAAASFADGTQKILSPAVVEAFVGTGQGPAAGPNTVSNCELPDFRDIHDTGAVVVHNMDRLFALSYTPAPNAANKAILAVKWIKSMTTLTAKYLTSNALPPAREYFYDFLKAGIKAASANGTTLTAAQCQLIDSRIMPTRANWRQETQLSCAN